MTSEEYIASLESRIRELEDKKSMSYAAEHLEMISEYVPAVLFEWYQNSSGENGFLFISSNSERIFGIPPEQLKKDFKLFPVNPEDSERWLESFKKASATKTMWHEEGRIKTAQKTERWFESVAYPAKVLGDKVIYFGIFMDVHERKLAEQSSKRNSTLLTSILNSIPVNIFIKDKEGRFTFMNEFCRSYLGVEGEVVGKTDFDIFPETTAKKLMNDDAAVRRSSLPGVKHEEEIYVNDELRTLIAGKQLFTDSENNEMLIGFSIDITESKRSQLQLEEQREFVRKVIDASPNLIFVKDRYGRFLLVNKAVSEIFGKSIEEIEFRANEEVHHHKDELDVYNEVEKKVVAEGRAVRVEEPFTKSDGTTTWYDTIKVPLEQKDGSVHILGISTDITDRKKFESDLVRAKLLAEESTRAKEQFLAHMSHELRTPMNAVVGLTHLLLEMKPLPEQQNYLNVIKASSEHLVMIINDILDLSKIEAGKLELHAEPFDIRESVHKVFDTIEVLAKEKKLELKTSIDSSIPKILVGDSVRLNQILINLLSNAVKFTDEGIVECSIKLDGELQTDETCNIAINVRDTGIGIPTERLASIFESFEQIEVKNKKKKMGTGLGLTIVKRLVEMQSGTISVKSTVGLGSGFSVIMPYKIGEDSATDLTSDYEPSDSVKKIELSQMRVLIAEDNEMNQLVVTNILDYWGVAYTVVSNGLECVNLLRKERFDIVLMDISMPVMDGLEATQIIRADRDKRVQATPIIALTAAALQDTKEKVQKIGMNGHISKPFKPQDLRNKLLQFLSIKNEQTPIGEAEKVSQVENVIVEEKMFNLSYIEEVSGGNASFVINMIDQFIKKTPQSISDLKRLIVEESEFKKIQKSAHTLKPTFHYLGIESLYEPIKLIERIAENEGNREELLRQMEIVEKISERALKQIVQYLEENKKGT